MNTSTGFHHWVLTDSGFNLHLIYQPKEEKRQKHPYRCFSILFSFLQEAFWHYLAAFTSFMDPALIWNMFLSYIKLKFLYSVTSRFSLQQCWACQTSACNRRPVVSPFIFNSLCSEMLLVTAQIAERFNTQRNLTPQNRMTNILHYMLIVAVLKESTFPLNLHCSLPEKKSVLDLVLALTEPKIWSWLWKPFVLRGLWREKGWRSGWCGPRTSARIGFLHLVVMYNSAQEAEDHLERASHTQLQRREEERRRRMQEVVRKRPIISARERGQLKKTVYMCVCVCPHGL